MKLAALALAGVSATSFAATVPTVSNVTMTQDSGRKVTISYTLTDGPAVVTLDIETNAPGGAWISIGGQNISGGTIDRGMPRGDVNKVVESGPRTITWRPDVAWGDQVISENGARAVVTAWAPNDTPDYLVVDLAKTCVERCRYYTGPEWLPGGLMENEAYRTTKLVMRKIRAKDVEWTMGSTGESGRSGDEVSHSVVMGHNFYCGVFEITDAQFESIRTDMTGITHNNYPAFPVQGAMRPRTRCTYREIRENANGTEGTDYWYPNDPGPTSFLGCLRTRTGIDNFDLPSEAEWEYAARAGHGEGFWGDGTYVSSDPVPGRYAENGGTFVNVTTSVRYAGADHNVSTLGPTNGTAVVGTYAPNDWGLYDMNGNVFEWCLDWYAADVSGATDGAVNTTQAVANKRVKRGGCYSSPATGCRPACRASDHVGGDGRGDQNGFRVVCRAGLD